MYVEPVGKSEDVDGSGLTDTFAYEVDDYNTIRRRSSGHKNGSLVKEEPQVASDVAFESIFADGKTRSVFIKLLDHSRKTKDAVSFPYRCDTLSTCNFYRLTVSISTARCVLFFNKLLGVDLRPVGVSWKRIPSKSSDALPVCSICNRIEFEEKWLYFQEMVDLDLWSGVDHEMLCASTICHVCESAIVQRIHQSQRTIER